MRLTGAILVVLGIMLTGCNQAPPKCSDQETLDLVKQIIFGDDFTKKEVDDNVTLEYPRAQSVDKEIKKINCQATLKVKGVNRVDQLIRYESQLDDKNQHIVTIELDPEDARYIKSTLHYLLIGTSNASEVDESTSQGTTVDDVPKADWKSRYNGDFKLKSDAISVGGSKVEDNLSEQKPPSAATEADADDEKVKEDAKKLVVSGNQAEETTNKAVPSFDCIKAQTNAERLICSSNELSIADSRLSSAYKIELLNALDKESFKAKQRNWTKKVRDNCLNVECMLEAYKNRLSELSH